MKEKEDAQVKVGYPVLTVCDHSLHHPISTKLPTGNPVHLGLATGPRPKASLGPSLVSLDRTIWLDLSPTSLGKPLFILTGRL